MNQELKTLELDCYSCEEATTHVMILHNEVRIGTIGIYPLKRDLSLYACEDCGAVRIDIHKDSPPSNE